MMTKLILIDNYDSFTFNLAQAFQVLGTEVIVRRNDTIGLEEAEAMQPTHLVISPGPGRPEQAGISMPMIERFKERIPVLGVCLGHQAISLVFGGTVGPAKALMHGKDSAVYHDESALYAGLPNPFQAGRYHSLSVPKSGLPDDFIIASHTSDGEIMGFHHQSLPILGVQFHPESILTPQGDQLLKNFLDMEPKHRSM
jgi:anthranilate synthase/aminodeoxychorismate synthase-like glutamine amidotransferase